jgi:hypothetical protein
MSLSAVPGDGEMRIPGTGMPQAGRQLRAASGVPVAWVEMFAPFGQRFPGLAPAVEEELDPELVRRAVMQYTRRARIGLVPALRPADILPHIGWAGACNHVADRFSSGSLA